MRSLRRLPKSSKRANRSPNRILIPNPNRSRRSESKFLLDRKTIGEGRRRRRAVAVDAIVAKAAAPRQVLTPGHAGHSRSESASPAPRASGVRISERIDTAKSGLCALTNRRCRVFRSKPMPAATDAGGIALRGRYGDPGLSSRLSLLEMQFRRLLTCSPIKLDEVGTSLPPGRAFCC